MKRWGKPLRDIGFIALLLFGLSFLPPDTSLVERQKQGVLRYCVGDQSSPLVTSPEGGPGPETQLVQKVADRIGVRLQVVESPDMTRAFNPRDWRLTRGRCDLVGGGLADSATNRGFMTLLPTGGRMGMVMVGELPPTGGQVAVYLGSAGVDRVKLSTFLRGQGLRSKPLQNLEALRAEVAAGGPVIFSTLAYVPEGVDLQPLPAEAGESYGLVLGLWRGDSTLTRITSKVIRDFFSQDDKSQEMSQENL